MNNAQIILVDDQDNAIGTMEKLEAHRRGCLHRAFSIFILNSRGHMLLQQRAHNKYHSGGLWTNACCSHPRPGETIAAAAQRRLQEEMGFQCKLRKLFTFTYRSELENGLIEHEYDHVLLGIYDGIITPDPEEIEAYQYLSIAKITTLLNQSPNAFTSWFQLAFYKVGNIIEVKKTIQQYCSKPGEGYSS